MTSLTVTDNEGYINIAELCQLVGLVDQGRLLSTQPFASSFGWFDSYDKGDYSLKIKGGTRYFKYSKLNYEIPENRKRTLGTSSKPDILQTRHPPNQTSSKSTITSPIKRQYIQLFRLWATDLRLAHFRKVIEQSA
jgi:hypothetical protein